MSILTLTKKENENFNFLKIHGLIYEYKLLGGKQNAMRPYLNKMRFEYEKKDHGDFDERVTSCYIAVLD